MKNTQCNAYWIKSTFVSFFNNQIKKRRRRDLKKKVPMIIN